MNSRGDSFPFSFFPSSQCSEQDSFFPSSEALCWKQVEISSRCHLVTPRLPETINRERLSNPHLHVGSSLWELPGTLAVTLTGSLQGGSVPEDEDRG